MGGALLLVAPEGDDEKEPLRCLRVYRTSTGLGFGGEEKVEICVAFVAALIWKKSRTRRHFNCLERSLQPIEAAPRLTAQLNRSTVLHVPEPPKKLCVQQQQQQFDCRIVSWALGTAELDFASVSIIPVSYS